MILINVPLMHFTDLNSQPLEDGNIYFGEVNQNPETNPLPVYWDDAGAQAAAQPIKTSNGYPVRNGKVASLFSDQERSITVRDKNGNLVFTSPSTFAIPAVINYVDNLDALRSTPLIGDFVIFVKSHTNLGDGGFGNFRYVYGAAPGTYVDNNGTIILPTGGDGSAAWLRIYNGDICVKWFGAQADGVTDDTVAVQSALTFYQLSEGRLTFGSGIFRISDNLIFEIPTTAEKSYNICGSDRGTIIYHTHATKTGLIIKGRKSIIVGMTLSNITIAGQGSATTGHLLENQLPAGLVLRDVTLLGSGGRAFQTWGERVTTYNLRILYCRQGIAAARSGLNECYFFGTEIISPGLTSDLIRPNGESANEYSYNINSVAGVFPSSPSVLVPDQHAAINWSSSQNIEFHGGSIKPLKHAAAIKLIGGMERSSLRHLYIEAYDTNAINPSVIYEGEIEKTTLASSITTGDLQITGSDFKWFLQTTGLADVTQYGLEYSSEVYAIYPPDYDSTSGAASSLGGGILQNDYEFINGRYIENNILTVNSGGRGYLSTSAKAWPAGAIIAQQFDYTARNTSNPGDAILLDSMHISSPYNAGGGVSVTHDPDTGKIFGGIILGVGRDLFNDPWMSSHGNRAVTLLNTRARGGVEAAKIYALSRNYLESLDTGLLTTALDGIGSNNIQAWQGFTYKYVSYTGGSNSLNRYKSAFPTKNSWTPFITFGGGSTGITYAQQEGYYWCVDELVHIWCRLVLSSKGSSSGTAIINGLPFTINNSNNQDGTAGGAISKWNNFVTITDPLLVSGIKNTTTLRMERSGYAGASISLQDTDFNNNSSINFSLTYRT